MKYLIGILKGLYNGTLFLNIPEYSILDITKSTVSTTIFVDEDGNDLENEIEDILDDVMKEGEWFIKLIFDGIEDYDPYE